MAPRRSCMTRRRSWSAHCRNTFMVKGKSVKFKGVNRHEASPENGRAITFDDTAS